jgi:hypothetical protein
VESSGEEPQCEGELLLLQTDDLVSVRSHSVPTVTCPGGALSQTPFPPPSPALSLPAELPVPLSAALILPMTPHPPTHPPPTHPPPTPPPPPIHAEPAPHLPSASCRVVCASVSCCSSVLMWSARRLASSCGHKHNSSSKGGGVSASSCWGEGGTTAQAPFSSGSGGGGNCGQEESVQPCTGVHT